MIDRATARERDMPGRDSLLFQQTEDNIVCALNSDSLMQDVLKNVRREAFRGRKVRQSATQELDQRSEVGF